MSDDDDQAHIWKFVATMARLNVRPQEIQLRYFDRSDLDLRLLESGYSVLGWQVWNPITSSTRGGPENHPKKRDFFTTKRWCAT
jgi:hypothetical protein